MNQTSEQALIKLGAFLGLVAIYCSISAGGILFFEFFFGRSTFITVAILLVSIILTRVIYSCIQEASNQ